MKGYEPGMSRVFIMIFLASKLQQYFEIKSAVEAKWDAIAILCLLLFFLSIVVFVYALMRPYGLMRKIVALFIAFPLAYGAAYVTIHKGLAPEFYRMACEDLMKRLEMPSAIGQKRCTVNNPIKLSRVKKDWDPLK